jgi:hypothetical protein
MEKIIETLKDYFKQVIESDALRERRCIIERELNEAIHSLEYVQRLCVENKIKLGD